MWDLYQNGSRVALVDGDREVTYDKLASICDGIQSKLSGRSLVFCLCTNTIGSIAGYLSFTDNDQVPLLLDAKLNDDLLAQLEQAYRPAYIWAPTSMGERFSSCTLIYEVEGYSLLETGLAPAFPMSDELCVLISTSGSTGSPKLVRQSRENILSNARAIIEYLGIEQGERAITSLPMNYVYGLSVVNTHILSGATLVLTELLPYAKQFWQIVARYGVTSFAGVPFTYEIMDQLKITKLDLPALKTFTQAGGKLSPELHLKYAQWARDTGKRFVVMYGASEATARMGYLPPEHSIEKQGSMGVPIPGGRFELVDANGDVIEEAGTVGELVYYGDNVTLGYALSGEDLIKPDENGGRLLTGDMAQRDEDGYYYIVGRKKRFLKILGKRINLDEVERLLKKHLDTVDIACSGRDDELWIFVVDERLKGEAVEYVFAELGVNRMLQKVQVIPEIPRNDSQKTLYSALPDL